MRVQIVRWIKFPDGDCKHLDCPSYIKEIKSQIRNTMLYTPISVIEATIQGSSTQATPPLPEKVNTNQKVIIYTNLTTEKDFLKALR
ncbi:hypothetical protein COK69_23680 [Bacillus cereus]|nr:hypothetical protein COK69_23680 [Bacillus cereus]